MMHLTLHDRVQMLKKDLDEGVLVSKEDTACLVFDLYKQLYFPQEPTQARVAPTIPTTTAGTKHDTSKPDLSLISPIAIAYLGGVLTAGAEEYSAHNWRKGLDKARLVAATFRHVLAILAGETYDEKTGLPHASHAMCELMFLVELQTSANFIDSTYHLDEHQQDLLVSLLADWKSGKVPPMSDL